jgi:hypothetical protein
MVLPPRIFFSLDPALPPICGFARTATIRAAAPSPETSEQMVAKRAAYYEYVAAGASTDHCCDSRY